MRRIGILVLALLLIININVLAKENFDVELIERERDYYYLGETIDYSLDVKLKKDPKDFRSINITFDLSDGLDYETAILEGEKIAKDSMEVKVTNSNGKARFINIEFNDLSKLNGVREFTIHIKAKVNENKNEGDKLTNRFIAYYQNANGTTGSYQRDFKSTGTVTYEKKLSETIKLYMANIYTDFMDEIQGVVSPDQKLRVRFGDLSTEPIVSKDGFFSFGVPTGTRSHINIDLLNNEGKVIDSTMLKFVGENNITKRDVLSVREALDNVGKTALVEEILKDTFVTDDSRTNYSLLKEIYLKTKEQKSGVVHHKPYMEGYENNTFRPKNTITRAEMSAVLSRIITKEEISEMRSDFKDVKEGQWYTKYVAHMKRERLMEGYEDGTFKPQNPMTRAELATIIARMEGLKAEEPVHFKDLDMNHWASDAINKVVNRGIMEGYPNGSFGPANKLTRAEAATIINRTLNRIPDEKTIKEKSILPFNDIKDHWSYLQVVEATYDHKAVYIDNKEVYE